MSWPQAFVAVVAAMTALGQTVNAIPMPSALPIPENRLAPVQHRLAFAGENGIAVSWNTYTQINKPQVFYGTSPNNLTTIASSNISQTYPTSTTFSNHVKLSNLLPDTTYYYKVSNTVDGFPIYNFTTPPKASSDKSKKGFKFAMAIDLGTMGPLGLSETTGSGAGGTLLPGERNTIDALAANIEDYELVWHPGDIAYADYWLKEQIQGYIQEVPVSEGYAVYESILNEFYEQISSVSARVPYMVGPGNHEANCDNGGTKDKKKGISYTVDICIPGQTNFTGYQSHWRMPNQESGGKDNMWYSYDYGLVHFVQINTETDFGNGIIGPDEPKGSAKENSGPFGKYANEQIDWLNKDLASVDRCKTPWVIVAGHRPWYTVGEDNICGDCQKAFESTLVKYNVDAAVFGHVHNYQRYNPVKFNKTDPNGLNNPDAPWYIVNGAAGHYDGMDPFDNGTRPSSFKYGFDDTYGWSLFTVHNATHLTHEFVASRNDSILDSATLYKKHDYTNICSVGSNNLVSNTNSTSNATSTKNSTIVNPTAPPQVNGASSSLVNGAGMIGAISFAVVGALML